ncbi:cellulase family glycosylhydrolase [Roseivirga pacifica]
MIKSLYYLFILSFSFSMLSCKEDEPTPPEQPEDDVVLQVDNTSYSFTAEGGSEALQITSNALWRFEFASDSWGKPSIQTSRGDATIQILAGENESTEARTATITLTSEGTDDITISLSQTGREPDPTEPEKPDYIDPDQTDMRNLTSVQLTELMGLGWNLGNSMEAITVNGDVLSGNENSWGNPTVTKTLIDAVKAAGFNTIRIPVSWSHMIEDEETFYIKYEWKQRVEEVVNYALENDMYAIINVHWDGGWMDHPDYENQDAINTKLAAFWKQIAKYFRDYDDKLLFAGTNEVHVEGNYNPPTAENAEVQNSFNQTFINTVRATGGRNTYRHLVVQTFNTNIEHGVNHLIIPEDETDDRMLVEVHFYDPYQFALQEDGGKSLWGRAHAGDAQHSGWGDEDWIDQTFASVKTNFVDAGYGVILGEYGAILRTELPSAGYDGHVTARNNYLNYVTSKALENGMVPVYWDNGHTGNNGFGLFDRATGEQAYADAIQAITSASN